jgi:hypothetical protein
MKSRILITLTLLLIGFSVYSQDTIIKSSGDTIICTIKNQDENTVYYNYNRGGQTVSSYVNKDEIKIIKSGNMKTVEVKLEKPVYASDVTTLGLGLGLDYGGIGANILVYPGKNLGLFAGGGYAIAGFGFNAGIKLRFLSEKSTSSWTFFLIGMYGYNTAIAVKNASGLNKLFYGPTIGLGFDFKSRPANRGYWSFSLLVPIRGSDVDNYIDDLESNYGVVFENKPLPIGIAIGYRIILDK